MNHALSELRQKKETDFDSEEEDNSINGDSNCLLASQFRKWLYRKELDLFRVRRRIPYSSNSFESLHDLELEQKVYKLLLNSLQK